MDFRNRNSKDINFKSSKDVDFRHPVGQNPFASTPQSFGGQNPFGSTPQSFAGQNQFASSQFGQPYGESSRSFSLDRRPDRFGAPHVQRIDGSSSFQKPFEDCSMERSHNDFDDFNTMDVVQYPIDKIRMARNALNSNNQSENLRRRGDDQQSKNQTRNRKSRSRNRNNQRRPSPKRTSPHRQGRIENPTNFRRNLSPKRERSPRRQETYNNRQQDSSRVDKHQPQINPLLPPNNSQLFNRSGNDQAPNLSQITPNLSQMNPNLSKMNPNLSKMNPNLSQMNPNLAQMNPNLAQMNPNLAQMNPNLAQMNPNLQLMVANLSQMIAASITQSVSGNLPQVGLPSMGMNNVPAANQGWNDPNKLAPSSGFQVQQVQRSDPHKVYNPEPFMGNRDDSFNDERYSPSRHMRQRSDSPNEWSRNQFRPSSMNAPLYSRERSPPRNQLPPNPSPWSPPGRGRSPFRPQSPQNVRNMFNPSFSPRRSPRMQSPARNRSPFNPRMGSPLRNRSPFNPRMWSPLRNRSPLRMQSPRKSPQRQRSPRNRVRRGSSRNRSPRRFSRSPQHRRNISPRHPSPRNRSPKQSLLTQPVWDQSGHNRPPQTPTFDNAMRQFSRIDVSQINPDAILSKMAETVKNVQAMSTALSNPNPSRPNRPNASTGPNRPNGPRPSGPNRPYSSTGQDRPEQRTNTSGRNRPPKAIRQRSSTGPNRPHGPNTQHPGPKTPSEYRMERIRQRALRRGNRPILSVQTPKVAPAKKQVEATEAVGPGKTEDPKK